MRFWKLAFMSLFLAACNNAKTEFIDGCVSGGAPKHICSCIYKNLEAKHGAEALEVANKDPYSNYPKSAEMVEDMLKYTQQCLGITTETEE